jgi:phenylalanyl-tRNA synthetase alpha chain
MSNEAERIAAGLHALERRVLPHLRQEGTLGDLVASAQLLDVEAMRALQWLEGKGCLSITTEEREFLVVNKTGQEVATHGWPLDIVLRALKAKGSLTVNEIAALMPAHDKGAAGAVLGHLKRDHVPFDPQQNRFRYVEAVRVSDPPGKALLATAREHGWKLTVNELNRAAALDLVKRGYAELQKRREKAYALTELGAALTKAKAASASYEERVTPAMLKDGSWEGKEFRPFNVVINVPRVNPGKEHFVTEAIAYIKRIWLDMGFEEMEGDHVQTAFWDLDALFVPQDHPAREMQDTFYLKDPVKGTLPKELFEKVRNVHENGGDTGSLGWRYMFNEEESKRNLLRTHTTVLSAQTLWKIKHGEKKIPGKYFSVSSVYRNEALDWKHLFELHQVEGIVVDKEANLQHLKGYLRAFFGKMGFPDVRIRPGHFPYTEPSAEVDVWDPKRNTWVELGGSGIFRPEVTKTLLGVEVPVLAWGLGMERTIMRYYDLKDIRDIYRNDLKQLEGMRMWMR